MAGQFQWQFDYLAADGETVVDREIPTYDPAGDVGGMPSRPLAPSTVADQHQRQPRVLRLQFLFKRDMVPGRTNMSELKVLPEDAGQTFRGNAPSCAGPAIA